jgi:hypothetical protein
LHVIMIDGTEGKAKLTAAWRAAVARMIEAGYTPADVHETLISVGMSGRRRWRHSSIIPVGVAIVSVSALLLFSGLVSTNSSAIWRTLLGSASEQQRDNTLLETRQALLLAHGEIEALKAEGSRALASAEAVRAAEAQGVEQQEALAQEREEAERLKRDLADARSEIEALKAEGSRTLASAEAVRAAEAQGVEQQEALAREREEAERLKRDLADARSEIEALKAEGSRALASAEAAAEGQTNQNAGEPQGTTGHGANPDPASTASTLAPTTPEQVLLARANSLLKDGDISGARLLLERAVQTGSSRAAFQLAETYDPRQLSRWRAHGIRGDWATAQALYVRAQEGGIMEAKDRIAPIQ